VLIVDDVKASADTLGTLLEGLCQSIPVSYDGASALKELAEFAPDIIFSDIAMPGTDGYSSAAQVRERLGDKPVLVALTGYGQKHDRHRALSAGFNHHLVRPTSVEKLTEILTTGSS
jgi:CheY-like chemotaxis protein